MKKNILKSITMDTETTFHENGDVTSNPKIWEVNKIPVTATGRTIDLRGRCLLRPSGNFHFQAYRSGTGSRYRTLYTVLNGTLKTTKRRKLMTLSFDERITSRQMADAIRSQANEIANYVEYNQD